MYIIKLCCYNCEKRTTAGRIVSDICTMVDKNFRYLIIKFSPCS